MWIPPAPSNDAQLPFFLTNRSCGHAGWLVMLHMKSGDVSTNPGPTTTHKQIWICDIWHRQIQVRKQISIWCNSIEHWVHLRSAGIRLAQYTDTWTCHQSRLTTHTDITPQHPPKPWPTNTTATKTQTPLSPCSFRISNRTSWSGGMIMA